MVRLVKKFLACGRSGGQGERKDGRIRVCVGKYAPPQIFELETIYLSHPLFEGLLEMSGEEFGYSYDGALRIACDVELFLYVLHLLRSRDPAAHYMELPDVMAKFYAQT